MPGDYSRFTDDFRERFSRLLMQQGKVQLDADWNELVEIFTRRDRLQANDTFGKVAVPRATTPDAFKITVSGSDYRIGAGRMYVGGVLAEAFANDGRDGNPLSFANQPFFIDPPAPPNGQGLLYLDVWERERTVVEDPELLEVALGDVDTSTRTQTVWQVKFLPQISFNNIPLGKLTCDTDLAARFASGGTLTVSLNLPPGEPDPCLLPETGGFRDVENRHYRVEIHGNAFPPQFKFARDPVVSEIDQLRTVSGNVVLQVRRIGRDPVLRFAKGDCVEVLNDRHELHGLPGLLAEVDAVDEFSREITLKAVSTNALPIAADVHSSLHPRLIRWDQELKPATPLLEVQFGVPIPLEAGIEVTFNGLPMRHGDYWMFPARAADRSVGHLIAAPPRGILHHYAPLALVDTTAVPQVRTDCRTLWPPECDCECAACVNPIDHNAGRFTIQMAIDDVKKKGGGKVCLKPGTYLFDRTIEIKSTNELTLIGHGNVTLDFTGNASEAILVEGSCDIVIEGIRLLRDSIAANGEGIGITIRNCMFDVIVRDCELLMRTEGSLSIFPNHGIGIALDGTVSDAEILRCVIFCNIGIGFIPSALSPPVRTLVFARVEIRGNFIFSSAVAVKIHGIGVAVSVRQNWIVASQQSCVWLEGTTPANYCNVVDENVLAAGRIGIGVTTDSTTISNNVIRGNFDYDKTLQALTVADPTFSSIAVFTASEEDLLESVLITGNRCSNALGMGIQISGQATGLMIKQNFISTTAGGGIVFTDKARASRAVVENNDLRDVAVGLDRGLAISAGIRIAAQCDVSVSANVIAGVGSGDFVRADQPWCVGIAVQAAEVARIHENRIGGVASSEQSACIDIVPPSGMIEITNNIIEVEGSSAAASPSHCYAIHVAGAPRGFAVIPSIATAVAATATPREVVAVPESSPDATAARFDQSTLRSTKNFDVAVWPEWPWITFPPSKSMLLIRANEMRFMGSLDTAKSMVLVEDRSARCTFGGNICVSLLTSELQTAVRLHAYTVVADSNQIIGTSLQDHGSVIGVALDITTTHTSASWTVLGNIVDGRITVTTNAALPQPWVALNRVF